MYSKGRGLAGDNLLQVRIAIWFKKSFILFDEIVDPYIGYNVRNIQSFYVGPDH